MQSATLPTTAPPVSSDAQGTDSTPNQLNRREFLTYAWGVAAGLMLVESGAALYAYTYPRFRAGEFGGKFQLGEAATLPPLDAVPEPHMDGKFWLVNTEEGPRALYMVCTHLGCLYKWSPADNRFQCPCHNSQFSREGTLLCGPASRGLDQFVVEAVENGEVLATTVETDAGIAPPAIGPATELVVDTGRRIPGLSVPVQCGAGST